LRPIGKNPTHAQQWPSTLRTYVYPVIGDLSVQAVDTALVMKILEPIWKTKSQTAARVRARIERVGDDTRLPPGREPSALARPHQKPVAGDIEGPSC